MLGSEAETAPPDEPPPPSWEDGPRRRGASRPPLAENTVPLKRGAPAVSSQRPARRPPPSKVSRASDAALDAAFLEFDLAAAAPPSKPPPPRPRPAPLRPPPAPAPAGAAASAGGPPARRLPAAASLAAAYAGGFHPGAQGEAAPRAVPARPPAPRSQGPRGPPGAASPPRRDPPAPTAPPCSRRRGATASARGPPRPRQQPPRRGQPAARPRGRLARRRVPPSTSPARDSLDAAFLAFDLPRRGPPPRAEACAPAGAASPTAAPPRPQPQPPRPATGPRTSLDAALLGFDLDGAVAEARAAVQTKRCRIVSVQGRGDALISVDGATKRLRLTGDWARAELRAGARGHLVPVGGRRRALCHASVLAGRHHDRPGVAVFLGGVSGSLCLSDGGRRGDGV